MSTTIDQRVVEMQFDNKKFEQNVATSMSTLDKLKQSLNMTGATKGFENLDAAAKKCDMSGLSGAVQTVQARFSALEVMAVTALANITNSAINAGKQLVSSLTIEPIKAGFQEYETQINAIQTIMANTSAKGTTLDDVTAALDELNKYADMTIYNFTEMTRNIGTFTAAGVDLDTSVSAIKGIANLAAVSGSTSQQASTAMYQLSQALASGTVKLMDWNSIVNAGMGGQVFQDALKETARVHGIAIDDMIESEGSFRETLKSGWLTSEVLTETLAKFTGDLNEEQLKTMGYTEEQIESIMKMGQTANDAATKVKTFTQLFDTLKEAAQSGWTQSWEIIVGDFEEAKALLTEMSDTFGGIIGASADARNEILQGWKDLGGRTALVEALRNTFEGILSIITPVKEAFREIFPPMTAEQLFNITNGLKELTSHLKLSETTSDNLKRTFKGLFAILDIVKQAFSAVFNAIKPLFGSLGDLGGGILGVTANWGDWLVKLSETIRTTDIFNKAIQGVIGFVKNVGIAIKDFFIAVKEKFDFPGLEIFHAFLERVHERMSQVGEAAGEMKSGVVIAVEMMGEALANSKFLQMLQALWDGVKTVVGGIASAIGSLGSGLVEKISNADFNGILDIVNSLIAGGIGVGLMKFLKSVTDTFKGFQDITDGIVDIFDGVRGCLEAYQTQLKAGTLLKIAGAIGILAASILVISLIDSDKLAASLGAITVLFADLMGSMALFSKISGNLKGVFKTTTAMIAISVAVLILASALKKIGDLDTKQLVTGLVGVIGLTATLVAAAKILGSGSSTMIKGAAQMVIFAAAIKILASACEDLAQLSWEELAKGLVGVGVLLAEISLFLNTAKFSGKSITTATGIVILASAIKILASVCEDFGQMKWEDLAKGLASIGVLLAEITLFTRLTGDAKHVISTGVALIAIGAAMKIFASAIEDMSGMSWEELAKGLVGMAGALAAVTIAVNFMPKNMVGIGVGLIAVSTSLVIMANALGKLGGMSWSEVAKGLVALGGSMAILAIGLNVMNGTLAGSAALLVAVAALAVLTPVLSILGAMSWESIAKGLVAIAGAFAIIGVAGLVLKPLVPTILGLGAAFALIGVGVLAIGAGLLAAGAGLSAIAIGITAIATAVAAGATAIVASLTIIITGVASLIPAVIEKIGEGIIDFCGVIAEGAPAIGEAVKAVVLSLIDVLVECVPAIANAVLELVAGVLAALVEYTPQIVDSVFQFLIGLLEGIARNLPGLIQAAIDVLMSFFSGIVDALSGIDTEVLLKGIAGIGLLSAIMVVLAAMAALAPAAMVGVLAMGVVIAELALVLSAIGKLAQIPGLTWLIEEGGNLLQGIGTAIGKFIGGIVGGFMSGVSSQFPQIGTDLSAFMTNIQPFIDGASKIDPSMMDGVKALAEVILLLTAANILDGLTSWFTGGSSLSGFAEELVPFGKAMKSFSDEVRGIDSETVSNAAIAGKTLAEMAATLPNSGGVLGFFAGENDMGAFGDQLVPFGRAMKTFAAEVAGLDAGVVTEAAIAGKALAEMADTVPNSGGVVGFFAGENDIEEFGKQLIPFGTAMKNFSFAVTGLRADVIQNSVTAGKALMELANTVPNTGGVVSWFTGDNDLVTFGEQLVPFGTAMKNYSLAVTGLDASVVANSANAAKALVELSNNLPNTGGIVSWFTGDNDIASFGEQLVSFGQSFAAYYASVSTVNTSLLSGVVTEFKNLVDLANGIKSVDTSGMSTFASNLTALGNAGIDGFINSFTNANSRVTTAANTMVTSFVNAANAKQGKLTTAFSNLIQVVITAINGKQALFTTEGAAIMTKFIAGIRTQDANVKTAFVTMVSGCLTVIKNKYYEFQTTGTTLIIQFIAGIRSKDSAVMNAFIVIISGCLTSIKNKYSDFYDAGKYLVEGFANGITAYTWYAEARTRAMANAAYEAAMDELDAASPSKLFTTVGTYVPMGFAMGIDKETGEVEDSAASMAKAAIKSTKAAISRVVDAINGDIDTQPTIRPVLDLSNVESGTNRLNAIFSRQQAISISSGMSQASDAEIQNGGNTSAAGNSYSFTQNNYSPKPLSRLEIYRQTKNQFSAMKGLVEA